MINDNFRFDRRLSQKAKDVYQFIVRDHIARTHSTVVLKYLAMEMNERVSDLQPFIDELIVAGYLEPTSFSGILNLITEV